MKRFSKMLAVLSVLAIGLAPFACSSALIAQAISGVSATPSSATQVTVTWRTSVESTSQVEYGLTTDYGLRSTLDSTSELIHIVNLTDLTGGIAYHFRVISKEAGGKETISDDFTFITPGLPPALTISNIKVADTSISSVSITWDTNLAATSQIEYGITAFYGTTTTLDTTLDIEHSVTLDGLVKETLYHFRVKSRSSTDDEAVSDDRWFTAGDAANIRLDVGITSNPNEFAPMKAENLNQVSLYGLIYETLYQKQEDGELVPCLAKSYDVSANKLEYTFDIDPRAKYSDGTAVTAADVKYAFEVGRRHRSQDHFSQTKAAWAQLDKVEVVDGSTVKFTLTESFGTFLDAISSVFIFPKDLWTAKEDTVSKWNAASSVSTFDDRKLYEYRPATDADKRAMLIGSGPFTFYEYVVDQWFWVKKNDNYWKTPANIDNVVFNIYPSSEAATNALRIGELDALVGVDTWSQMTTFLEQDSDIEIDVLTEFNHSTMFMMNLRKAPFNFLSVRKAVDKAIDREDIIEFAQYGYGQMPQNAPYGPGLPDSNPNIKWNSASKSHATLVAEANALLDSVPGMSGIAIADGGDGTYRKYDDGTGNGSQIMEFNCTYINTSTGYEKGVDLVIADLREIGIKINHDGVQANVIGPALFSGWRIWEWDTAFFGYGTDPAFETLVRQWSNEPFGGGYDGAVIGWNNDPEQDDLALAGNGGRPMTYDTPDWENATQTEKDHYANIYAQMVMESAPLIEALQDIRRITNPDDYHDAALEIQQMFEDLLPVSIMYHASFISAYRTDRFSGWGDPRGVYYYGLASPVTSVNTLMRLTPA